jgi:hypothetical protein
MTPGTIYQHARVKAIALAHGYVHALRASGRLAAARRADRQSLRLPLAA